MRKCKVIILIICVWAGQTASLQCAGALSGRGAPRRAPPVAAVSPQELSLLHEFDFVTSSDKAVEEVAATVFSMMRKEGAELFGNPLTSALAARCVLKHNSLSASLASVVATKVKYTDLPGAFDDESSARSDLASHERALRTTFTDVMSRPDVLRAVTSDLVKAFIVDPAADGVLQPALYFKGFHALAVYRVAHSLWQAGSPANRGAALMLQSRASELFAVDIHPGACIGNGVMLDHATGVVIGSTAILGNDLYILHGVTLGATGKPTGGAKRHPTIGSHVVLGAGCTVLGDITVANDATVGAKAIVTKDVPEGDTCVGVNKLLGTGCLVVNSSPSTDAPSNGQEVEAKANSGGKRAMYEYQPDRPLVNAFGMYEGPDEIAAAVGDQPADDEGWTSANLLGYAWMYDPENDFAI